MPQQESIPTVSRATPSPRCRGGEVDRIRGLVVLFKGLSLAFLAIGVYMLVRFATFPPPSAWPQDPHSVDISIDHLWVPYSTYKLHEAFLWQGELALTFSGISAYLLGMLSVPSRRRLLTWLFIVAANVYLEPFYLWTSTVVQLPIVSYLNDDIRQRFVIDLTLPLVAVVVGFLGAYASRGGGLVRLVNGLRVLFLTMLPLGYLVTYHTPYGDEFVVTMQELSSYTEWYTNRDLFSTCLVMVPATTAILVCFQVARRGMNQPTASSRNGG